MSETASTAIDGRSRTWFSSTRQPTKRGGAREYKNIITKDFMRSISEDFSLHGVATIATVRETEPAKYLQIVASLMPKEIDVRSTDDADTERLELAIAMLDRIIEARAIKDVTDVVEVVNADDRPE